MHNEFIRTQMLIGDKVLKKLEKSRVAVFGIGGVGSYVVEAFARSAVGKLDLIDNDTVVLSNINRQLIALHSTVGMKKTEAAKRRVLDINPQAEVRTFDCFFSAETMNDFNFLEYDYVVDAIDTVTSKLLLIECAKKAGTKIISCMGTGNKLDPTQFEITDIYKTRECPLAKVMRKELKKRSINSLDVLYSPEPPKTPIDCGEEPQQGRRSTPASIAFVPSVAGLIIASKVVKDLTDE